jgi:hypothetical protein
VADFVGVGVAGFVGVGFGVGVADAVGVGVGLGVGVVATTSGDGTDAGELATSVLAMALSGPELAGLAMGEPGFAAPVVAAGEPTGDVAPAEDG